MWLPILLTICIVIGACIVWYVVSHQHQSSEQPTSSLEEEINQLSAQRDILLSNIEDLKRAQKDLRDSNSAASTLVEDRLQQAEITLQKLAKLEERYNFLLPVVNQLTEDEEQAKKEIESLNANLYELQQRSKMAILKMRTETSNQGGNKLELEDFEKIEIAALEEVIPMLRNPLALNRAIYDVYFRARMKKMRELLQVDGKTGIYRVWATDAATGTMHCYVGQAVDIGERWNTHLKRLVGAEEGTKVAFYRDAKKYLLDLRWEVLQICKKEELNAAEHYWIEYFGGISDWNSRS